MVQRLCLGRAQPGRHVRLGAGELPVLDLLGRAALGFTLLLAVRVDEGVGQNAVQPRLEVGALAELVEGRVRLGVGLLDQVLRVGGVARHAQRRGVHLVQKGQSIPFEARVPFGLGLHGLLVRGVVGPGDRTHLLRCGCCGPSGGSTRIGE